MHALSTPDAPAAIGPYSQGIQVGSMVFLSGQIPLDPSTGQIVAGGIDKQTERVMNNLQAVLAAAGCTFEQVVRTTIYLTDLAHFQTVNEVYGRYFPGTPPARVTIQVAALPRGSHVEIDAIAIKS